jgi:hypothetical protein
MFVKKIIPQYFKNKRRSLPYIQRKQAKKLASTSKRIDICAAQFAHSLHLKDQLSLSGKVCLEIGSGWVLSHALICHLLGAKRVIATDVTTLAKPQYLYRALHESVISIIRDVLSPYEDHTLIRKRLENLLNIKHFNHATLKELGIEYIAPVDLANNKLDIAVDFIYSNSVLEHVPVDEVAPLLKNLSKDLKPNGIMIHRIHLEDHKSISDNPFGFLAIPEKNYASDLQSKRGNRIRKSTWLKLFNDISNIRSEAIYEWTRENKKLPSSIDQSIAYIDQADLMISHLGIFSKKNTD